MDLRVEVGLLSRNVVIQGDEASSSQLCVLIEILILCTKCYRCVRKGCSSRFTLLHFAAGCVLSFVTTLLHFVLCPVVSHRYGVHIAAMHGAILRMSGTEVRRCGQAFVFGRYAEGREG